MFTLQSHLIPQKKGETERTAVQDAISQLADQIPRPCIDSQSSAGLPLQKYVLLTRDFNAVMDPPVRSAPQCMTKERGQTYGRMLREEVLEVEQAIETGRLHDVLAESADVLCLEFNLVWYSTLSRSVVLNRPWVLPSS